jgi:TIR domain
MAHDVFVSHSVKDKAVAEAIVARLEAESVTCWIAPRDVMPGADWGESIIDAIESSRIMILIFSQSANTSTQIKREVERAVNKGVYIIPFRVDDIPPTRSLEYFISTSQWMDAFSPPLERHLDTLAKTVTAVLKRPPLPAAHVPTQPEKPSIPTPPIPPSRRKSILIAATIAAFGR